MISRDVNVSQIPIQLWTSVIHMDSDLVYPPDELDKSNLF